METEIKLSIQPILLDVIRVFPGAIPVKTIAEFKPDGTTTVTIVWTIPMTTAM